MGKKKKEDYKLSDLKRMGSELLSSQKKYVNNLPILIGFLKPSSPPNYVMESLLSLQSFFTPILTSINNTNKHLNNPDSADFIYNTWMRSKFDDFTNSLLDIFVSRDQNGVIRQVVMDTIMDFVKMGGAGGNLFNSSLYHAFINSILRRMTFIKDDDDSMLHVFASKYFDYMDVRYFTYISIHNIATTLHTNSISTDGIDAPDSLSSNSKDLPIKNMLYILLHIPPPDASTTKEPDHSPMWTASSDSPSKEAKRKHLKLDKSNNNVGHEAYERPLTGMDGVGFDPEMDDSLFGPNGGGADVQVSVELSFMEAVQGCAKTVTFQTALACGTCDGTGVPPGTKPETCKCCKGSGKTSKQTGPMHYTCRQCDGTGKFVKVLSATKIAKKMKLKFTKAWISFLRLPLPVDVYKEVLVSLHQAVIPYMSNPIMLCDFLTRSYDIGGVISVMALSGLYVLMTQHGLEYPKFYEKLYALLVPSVFNAKHRAKFFELLDSCLKSPLLPAYLAASFAKKLSRLSLSAPPSGGFIIVALIHNLLRRHPSINFLVHQEGAQVNSNVDEVSEGGTKSSGTVGMDHFNNEESDPLKTNAMRSSLWEIDSLRHHYCPPVTRFVLSLENDLTVRSKTTEVAVKDFSGGSYATIFGEEIRRRVKQVPLAFYKATPTSLFSEADFPGWSFKHEDDGNVAAKRQRIECA